MKADTMKAGAECRANDSMNKAGGE